MRKLWSMPLPLVLIPTEDAMSFSGMAPGTTGLPLPPHPGAYGVRRRFHTHEGIDLYAAEGTSVLAVEPGEVRAVKQFTGPELGQDWWLPTYGVWVEGSSGVVLYGEITPAVSVGQLVRAGDVVGAVTRVLKVDKGRPTSMLHLELHTPGSTEAPEWLDHDRRPEVLLDPTPLLMESILALN